jgi:hypothetical protein
MHAHTHIHAGYSFTTKMVYVGTHVTYLQTYTYIHTDIHPYITTHTYIHAHTYTHTGCSYTTKMLYVGTRITYIHTHIHTRTHIHTHRMFIYDKDGICRDARHVTTWYFYVTGGDTWFYLFVSVPSAVVSGYLTYR